MLLLIKERIKNGNALIKSTTDSIELAIGKAFTAQAYIKIQVDPKVDDKIAAKTSEIVTGKSYQEIQTKFALLDIPLIPYPFDIQQTKDTVIKSIDTISTLYLAKFNEHKNHLTIPEKENWLKSGYEAIENNTCPFCLRKFDSTVDIIEAYKQYFNAEYNSLLTDIASLKKSAVEFNLVAEVLAIENKIENNLTAIEFWKQHIPHPPMLLPLSEKQLELEKSFDAAKAIIENKLNNPLLFIDNQGIDLFGEELKSFNKIVTEYNIEISAYNLKIIELKGKTPPNLILLEVELKKLEAIKRRGDVTLAKHCDNLDGYITGVNVLNDDKVEKQSKLDTYSVTIFKDYALKINQYLKSFAPYLEIKNLDSAYVGSSTVPMIKYALHIDGNEIKQDDNSTQPNFKYSLSEGDKSALAIAFFLTKLELDANLKDKIVVFDDPISSFDLNRKSTTINKLLNFAQLTDQMFVLTHNIVFACEFWKSAGHTKIPNQCSKIEFISNSSCIVDYNIDTETLSSILKDSLKIKTYIEQGCYTDEDRRATARCLRPALESYFGLKFFDVVADGDWLGDFLKKIRDSSSSDKFFRLKNSLSELSDINDYSKKFHHRFNTNNDSEPITDAELKNYCVKTLEQIQLI